MRSNTAPGVDSLVLEPASARSMASFGTATSNPELRDSGRSACPCVSADKRALDLLCLLAGLPVVLYSKIPGQEDGNVDFVVSEGAGVWAPKPQQVVRALTRWLTRPEEKRAAMQAAKRAARPDAARRIARLLVERLRARQPSTVRTTGG